MPYELTADVKENVLVATVSGTRTFETVVAIAKEIKSLCKSKGADKVLIDVRDLEGHLRALDIFFLVTKHFITLKDRRVLRKAAVLDKELTTDRHRFLENVAVNRGYRFQLFDDFDEALRWLR